LSATNTARSSVSGKKTKKDNRFQKAVNTRWQERFESEEACKEYFLNCDLSDGVQELGKLRKMVEIASNAYNENIQRGQGEICANPKCRKVMGPSNPHYNRQVIKDKDSGKVRNVFTCSRACYLAVWATKGNPEDLAAART